MRLKMMKLTFSKVSLSLAALALLAVFGLAGCGGGGGENNSSSGQTQTTTSTVGSNGGSVNLSDGSNVSIDQGVMKDGTIVTVTQLSTPSVALAEGETLASPVVQVEILSTSLLSAPSPDKGIYLTIQTQTPSSSSSAKRMRAASLSDIYKTVRVTISNHSCPVRELHKFHG